MKKAIVLLAVASLIAAVPLSGKSKKEAPDISVALAKVTENVSKRDMMIYAQEASTPYGFVMNLNEPYYIRILGNRIDSHLPYIGQAFDPFSGSEGLMFRGVIKQFKVVNKRKKIKEVSFEADTLDDSYKFLITISSDGSMEMTVSPMKKQPMYFDGYLAPDAKNYTGKL